MDLQSIGMCSGEEYGPAVYGYICSGTVFGSVVYGFGLSGSI